LILDRHDPKEQDMEQIRSASMAGRTVLVTGASGGIGQATALGLARMGAHLAITGRPPSQRCGGWLGRYARAFRGSTS
jgi:NAD(P)-dependent dehydrogenase (short-subunit alcohol dehydrogenase family)